MKKNMKENMKKNKHEDAVSPVIGVILMVVITVIIAAIVAVFAFSMGPPPKAPQMQLKFVAVNWTNTTTPPASYNTNFTVSNTGGDTLVFNNSEISIIYAINGTASSISSQAMNTLNIYSSNGLYTLPPGTTMKFQTGAFGTGTLLEITVLDVPSGQLITDNKITVQ